MYPACSFAVGKVTGIAVGQQQFVGQVHAVVGTEHRVHLAQRHDRERAELGFGIRRLRAWRRCRLPQP